MRWGWWRYRWRWEHCRQWQQWDFDRYGPTAAGWCGHFYDPGSQQCPRHRNCLIFYLTDFSVNNTTQATICDIYTFYSVWILFIGGNSGLTQILSPFWAAFSFFELNIKQNLDTKPPLMTPIRRQNGAQFSSTIPRSEVTKAMTRTRANVSGPMFTSSPSVTIRDTQFLTPRRQRNYRKHGEYHQLEMPTTTSRRHLVRDRWAHDYD